MKVRNLVRVFTLGCVFLCFTNVFGQSQWLDDLKNAQWVGMVAKVELLKSTKQDVTRILGQPESSSPGEADFIMYYQTKVGRVDVTFSTKECYLNDGRLIPKGVVEEIGLKPNKRIFIQNLNLPLDQFLVTVDNDAPVFEYTNKEYGITFVKQVDGLVTHLWFQRPPSKTGGC